MIPIKIFILGFLLGTIGTQIIEGINNIFFMLVELIKAKISASIAKCNNEIDSLDNSAIKLPAIGFVASTEEGESEIDDD